MKMRFSLLITLLCFNFGVSFAQTTQRDPDKEKVILDQLQAIAPDTVEDFKAATRALDGGDYVEATRLYEAVRKKAPDFDHVLRRLGLSLSSQGNQAEGLKFLEQAVKKNRSPENLTSLANSLAYPGRDKKATREQKRRALTLAIEADQFPENKDDAHSQVLLAQLALEFDRLDLFRKATTNLVAKHPDLMVTHYFNAVLAATDQKWVMAEKEIRKAESLGLPRDVVQRFLDSGVQTQLNVWRYATYALVLVAAWIGGLTLLFLLGKLMSKKTLRSIETGNPNVAANQSDLSLRKWYRALISIGGAYYFLSIPVVIFLVLAVAGSITYGFYSLGRIPIKLVAVVCLAALITVFKMVQSLFVKIEKEDPGRSLSREEAPRLWDLTQKVANVVQTRPIDEIRITPGTDLAVYEKGGFRQRSRDKARRILILGVGVLNGFRVNDFRAVLAHEYGHFSNRDTAGGDLALRVNDHMMRFAHAMMVSGLAVWWNIGFQFLRVYHFIFRRISHGATRLQEVLADRVAASRYGALAFEGGLRHVVRKSVEFNLVATREINESTNSQRALNNLYELPLTERADLEKQTEEELNRETTEDDTHPSPRDRFRFTGRIIGQSEPLVSGMIWDLFTDREALTREMTSLIQQRLQGSA